MSDYDSSSYNHNRSDPNCRTCHDFKSWSQRQREILYSGKKNSNIEKNDERPEREDCPLDKVELGRSTWGLLHTIGATYPDKPTDEQRKDVKTFFDILSRVYPCEYCAQDLRKELKKYPVDATSQKAFSLWLCKLHNTVNKKLGKPLFDCSKANQRWRDGWPDGSCD